MKDHLKNTRMFEGIDDSIISKVASFSTLEKYDAETTILKEDSSDDCDLFIVVKGRVKIFVSSKFFSSETEESKSIYTVNPGDFFGEMSCIVKKRRSASAVTLTACELIRIDGDKFTAYLEKDPKAGFVVLKRLYEALYERIQSSNFMLRNILI